MNYFTMGIQQRPWNDYVEGMEHTFDSLSAAIRSEYDKPSSVAVFIGALTARFLSGVAIGLGIAAGLAIARASVGL